MNFATDFWMPYPRKVAKAHAEKMWNRLKESEKQDALAALPYHIRQWNTEKRTLDRIPHAASWLNPKDGRRWEDSIPGVYQFNNTPPEIASVQKAPTHFCEICNHEWLCRQPDTCSASRDLVCPEVAARWLK